MLSALSRVVALTLVNNASNSFKFPPEDLNTPPALLITSIKSAASTANAPATAFTELNCPSSAPTPCLNCARMATAPSVVSARLSKFGANADLAKASKAILASSKLTPA